jgi:hypothetical protein
MKRHLKVLAPVLLALATQQAAAAGLEPQLGAFSRIVVPTSANVGGQNNTFFRTRLAILNVTQQSYTVQAILYSGGGQVAIANIPMSPGGLVNYENVLQELFGFVGAGAIVFDSFGAGREFFVTAEVYNEKVGCGRFYTVVTGGPILEPSLAEFDNLSLGVFVDSANRTNVGIFNDSNTESTVVYELFNASGARLAQVSRTVGGKTWNQFSLNEASVTGGYIRWRVTGGPVFLWAVVVDNASGDGTFLPAADVIP